MSNMIEKSILICHPGRCGSHWLLNILRKLTGLETLPAWPGTMSIPPEGYILGTREKLANLTAVQDTLDILFLLRDPRDVETSMRLYRFPGNFDGDANAIVNHLGWFRWYLEVHHQRYPVIRFEQLWSDPVTAINSLLAAMGRPIPKEPRLCEILEQESFEVYSQGRTRGQEDTSSHHRKGVIGDWRSHWSSKKTTKFLLRFRKEMRQLGYD